MEQHLEDHGFGPVAGVDEAGRGACCGPVTIAACVLPSGHLPELPVDGFEEAVPGETGTALRHHC